MSLQTLGPDWLITTFYNGIQHIGHMVALSASYKSADGKTASTVSASRDASGQLEMEAELVHRPPLPILKVPPCSNNSTLFALASLPGFDRDRPWMANA